MKPPRKPSRPSSSRPGTAGPRRPATGKRPARSEGKSEDTLVRKSDSARVAASWGVSPDVLSPKTKGDKSRSKATRANIRGGDGAPSSDRPRPNAAPNRRADGKTGDTAERSKRTRPAYDGQGRSGQQGDSRRPGDNRPRTGAPSGRPSRFAAADARSRPPRPRSSDTTSVSSSPKASYKSAPKAPLRSKASGEPQRIAKLLARAGIASRREIERMIEEGRIAVDGVTLDTPATLLANLRGVTVDGQPVAEAEAPRLFLFNKPTGCLTTERDPAGRPTIYDRLPADLPRLMPVGRLDMTTEGLLLLTNDGELKRYLELPANGVERTYRARAFGEVSQAQLEELIEGIEVEGIRYGRIDANLERRTGRNQWIEMTLSEGKNREVRRVLEHLGLQVNRLIRVRYGPFDLADSAPGALVEIKRGDMDRFLHYLKNPSQQEIS